MENHVIRRAITCTIGNIDTMQYCSMQVHNKQSKIAVDMMFLKRASGTRVESDENVFCVQPLHGTVARILMGTLLV